MKFNKSGNNNWRGRITRYAPLFLWIGVISYLSSNSGSMEETSRFIGPLLHFLFPDTLEETLQIYHGYIRKAAHLTEYAILAFLALRAFLRPSVARYILPIVLVAVIATIDEFNQSFEASRTSSAWDVLLDIAGGVAMIFVIWLFQRPRHGGRMYRPFNRS